METPFKLPEGENIQQKHKDKETPPTIESLEKILKSLEQLIELNQSELDRSSDPLEKLEFLNKIKNYKNRKEQVSADINQKKSQKSVLTASSDNDNKEPDSIPKPEPKPSITPRTQEPQITSRDIQQTGPLRLARKSEVAGGNPYDLFPEAQKTEVKDAIQSYINKLDISVLQSINSNMDENRNKPVAGKIDEIQLSNGDKYQVQFNFTRSLINRSSYSFSFEKPFITKLS